MDLVQKLGGVETNHRDTPVVPVQVKSVTIEG